MQHSNRSFIARAATFALGITLLLSSTVTLSAAGASGATPATWSTPTTVAGVTTLTTRYSDATAVTCPSVGDCVQGGSFGANANETQPYLEEERNGVWEPAVAVPGIASLNTAEAGSVTSISCPAVGDCVAVGYYSYVLSNSIVLAYFVVSETAGAWGAATPLANIAGTTSPPHSPLVACTSVGNCVAAGPRASTTNNSFVVNEVAGVWGAATALPGTSNGVTNGSYAVSDLACPSAGNCAVVGNFESPGGSHAFGATESSGTWSAAVELPGTAALNTATDAGPPRLSCPSAEHCTATGTYEGAANRFSTYVVSETSGTWTTAIQIPGLATLSPNGQGAVAAPVIACGSTGNCLVSGQFDKGAFRDAFVATEVAGTWGAAMVTPGMDALASSFANASAVVCTDAADCTVTGTYDLSGGFGYLGNYVISKTAGTWGAAQAVTGLAAVHASGTTSSPSLACPAASRCVVVGDFDTASFPSGPFPSAYLAVETNGVWADLVALPGSDSFSGFGKSSAQTLSCPSAGNCAVAGTFFLNGNTNVFVNDETSGTWGAAIALPGIEPNNGYASVNGLSCASAGNCAVVGYETTYVQAPFVADEVNGVWGSAHAVPGFAALDVGTPQSSNPNVATAVACPAAGDCVMVGEYLDASNLTQTFVDTESNGTWGTATEIPGMSTLNAGNAGTGSVSCSGVGDCAIAGSYQNASHQSELFVINESSGTWGSPTQIPGTASTATNSLNVAVSCPASGACAVAGSIATGNGAPQAFVDSQSSGVWGTAMALPQMSTLDGGAMSGVSGLSCPSVGNCAVVGVYDPGTGTYDSFVADETAGVWNSAVPESTQLRWSSGDPRNPQISCSSAGNCGVILNPLNGATTADGGDVAVEKAGVWSAPVTFTNQLNQSLYAVACPQSAACTVAGQNVFSLNPNEHQAVVATQGFAPDAPTLDVPVSGDGAATVTWSPPANAGSGSISSFVATAVGGGQTASCTASGVATSCEIANLIARQSYSVTVVATNAFGSSIDSSAQLVTPYGIPDAPTLTTEVASNGQVAVSWDPPANDGGSVVTSYHVTTASGNQTCDSATTTCTLKGLNPLSPYVVNVTAINAAGSGPTTTSSTPVYPFGTSALSVELPVVVLTKGAAATVIVGGATPGSSVSVSAVGAASQKCTANAFGQCVAKLKETLNGIIKVNVSDASSLVAAFLYVPLVKAPSVITHGTVATFTVSFCPKSSSVKLKFSGGIVASATANAQGVASVKVKFPHAGKYTMSVTVQNVVLATVGSLTVH